MRKVVGACCLVAILGCGSKKPSTLTGAPSTPPDESYQLGSVGSQEGFLWTCTGGEHVHLWRNCGEMLGCGAWKMARGPCGTTLGSEPVKSERSAMTYGKWE